MDQQITIDPHVCHGQACIKGTRIPVHLLLRELSLFPRFCNTVANIS